MGKAQRVRLDMGLLSALLTRSTGSARSMADAARWLVNHGCQALSSEEWLVPEEQLRLIPPQAILRQEESM